MEEIELYTLSQLANLLGISEASVEGRLREYRRLYDLGMKVEAKRVCPPPIVLGPANITRFSKRHINEFFEDIDEMERI